MYCRSVDELPSYAVFIHSIRLIAYRQKIIIIITLLIDRAMKAKTGKIAENSITNCMSYKHQIKKIFYYTINKIDKQIEEQRLYNSSEQIFVKVGIE